MLQSFAKFNYQPQSGYLTQEILTTTSLFREEVSLYWGTAIGVSVITVRLFFVFGAISASLADHTIKSRLEEKNVLDQLPIFLNGGYNRSLLLGD